MTRGSDTHAAGDKPGTESSHVTVDVVWQRLLPGPQLRSLAEMVQWGPLACADQCLACCAQARNSRSHSHAVLGLAGS
jgi:hypothetical protein